MTELAGTAPATWDDVIAAIGPLADLRDDWDGLGAAAPLPGVVDTALDLAGYMRQSSHAVPGVAAATPAGTILFCWTVPGGIYQEIEVVAAGRAEQMILLQGREPVHATMEVHRLEPRP